MYPKITAFALAALSTLTNAAPVEPAALQRRCTPGAYSCLNLFGVIPDEIVSSSHEAILVYELIFLL